MAQGSLQNRVIGALGDLVFVYDAEGRFIDCFNEDKHGLLLPRAQFMGRHHAEVLPDTVSTLLSSAMDRVRRRSAETETFEYELPMGDAAARFSCSLSCILCNDGTAVDCFIAVIRDVSHLSLQRAAIEHKEQVLQASARANQELLKNRNIVQAAGIGLRELGLAMKVDRCYLFRNSWNEELGEYVSNQLLEWANDFVEPQINNPDIQNVPFSASHPFMEPLLRNEPFFCIVPALPPGSLRDQILGPQGIKSLLALPVRVKEELWGFVGFDDCTSEREWSSADVSILTSFATSIATAITRRHIEDDLEKSKIEAEKANSAKSAFLSNITHEIRTPLHGVIGYAEMLTSFRFPHPEDEYFSNLKLSASTLYELINNILDFSKIEAGVFEMSPENYLLADIIQSAVGSVSYLLKSSGNRLVTDMAAPGIPEVVFVDATRLKQVLVNLLSNAIKFSVDSTVELGLAIVPEGLRFSVTDHGIGISEENLQMLFKPFSQFDSSFSKKYQGTGLGLSITRHILEQMGSRPEVRSVVGKGSTFTFVLPLQSILPRDLPRSSAEPVPMSLQDLELELLLVEDNRLNMKLAETVLLDLVPRIRLYKAANGMEAVHLIETGIRPDLVLMDLQMPLMDGFETTRIIRELYHEPLTIVALTASALSDVRDRCLESGMDDFLAKPFTRDQVASLLRRHAGLA